MATEKRLIDANALIKKARLMEEPDRNGIYCLTPAVSVFAIEDAPTVDAVEVVHGEWRNNKDDYPQCDKCGYMPQYDYMIDDIWCSPFCPNCGAKMDGDVNGRTD